MNLHVTRLFCNLIILALPSTHAQAKPTRLAVILDTKGNVQSFYGVPVKLTLSGLKRLPFPVKKGFHFGEGDRHTHYTITALEGVRVVVQFANDGKLYGVDTASPNAVALKGIGIGSTLAKVSKAWPAGRLLYGFEDGYFATYVTGTNVLLRFNPDELPKGAFDHERPIDFPVPDTIKVQKISVYPESNPVPKGIAPPDPNRISSTTENSERKIISRLDVERLPGTSLVRLIWTQHGKVEADQMIDVSQYPDFDIWTRNVVHTPEPFVISFQYGNFKDCGVRKDDRDTVYVTLKLTGAMISPSPPPGVKIWDNPAMPKYIGNSMTSAAHGCRRTYDPATGAFGLEKVQ